MTPRKPGVLWIPLVVVLVFGASSTPARGQAPGEAASPSTDEQETPEQDRAGSGTRATPANALQPAEAATEHEAGQGEAADMASAAVFRTAAADAALRDLAGALDPVVLHALGELEAVQVTARPPLDLAGTQLALDCVGETRACLRSVADQVGAQVLIAPSLQRADQEVVVTLLYFDAGEADVLRTVSRRHRGEGVERAVLDAVPDMLRELLALPEPAKPPEEASAGGEDPGPAPDLAAAPPVSPARAPALEVERNHWPLVPVAITAAGVVVLGVGIALGLAANASEDAYADAPTDTRNQVDAAIDELDAAETQATLANVGMGLGAAGIALGATLWVLELTQGSEERAEPGTALVPSVAPGRLGLVLRGDFSGVGD